MTRFVLKGLLLFCLLMVAQGYAAICPDPNHGPLQRGEIPEPWRINPFSEHWPQRENNTRFVRANILVAGMGRGVLCTYQNSVGYYSIWWEVNVKIPARIENQWRSSLAGFECTSSVDECEFYPGS